MPKFGLEFEKGENKYKKARFVPRIDKTIFIDKEQTYSSMNKKGCILLNALTSDLHRGENSRYGRPGRIPGSKNIPFEELVEDSQKLISPRKAQAIFKNKNINQKIRVLNYCGGGIAATLNAFVLRQLGIEKIEIYDNSMSEWAMDHQLPIEKDNVLK